MTPEEYLALPEEKPYLEYVDGMVLQKPMPNEDHSLLAMEVGFRLKLWTTSFGGRVGVEARTRLGVLPNFRLPDVSYWSQGTARGDDTLPNLAVEIRSPGQTMGELRQKCRFYRSMGVDACWLIDPVSCTAEAFEGERDAVAVEVLAAGCLPGFVLPLATLFAVLDEE